MLSPAHEGPLSDRLEALFLEVRVEAEDPTHADAPHDLEADAIHEAQLAPPCSENSGNASPVKQLVDPVNPQQRTNALLELSGRLDSPASLQERERLDQDLVCGKQWLVSCAERVPQPHGFLVLNTVSVSHRDEGRCVHEDAHDP